ncbi:MAG: hypothetical protein QOF02_4044 [Blastocatellia bacterium]|nr:hypothetical protein [Blastocatellia bacterium]
MSSKTLNATLDRLEELKRSFGTSESLRVGKTLSQLARRRFTDAASLIRFHEILLFLRAYPRDSATLRQTEDLLDSFHQRVEQLYAAGAEDLYALTEPEVSGIAGTSFVALWGYDIVRHLAASHPARVEIDWEDYEGEATLIAVLKILLPFFEDGAYVEYPVPYLKWLRAAKTRGERDLACLLRCFEQYEIPYKEKAALFEALKIWVHWELGNSQATRTKMRRPAPRVFYHDRPLLGRRDVSLARELEDSAPLPLEKLSKHEGLKLLSQGRDTMAVRYRELHGFTHGDARHVLRVDAGRGVEFYVWGVPSARRLPLLAYHSMLICKNGVPAGYSESLSLFERSECGLNLFYTFRDGESAWIYARLLRLFRQYLGVKVFSIDPYQLGFKNEEGIESGSFWFYRKLGFRPIQPKLARLVLSEERKIAALPGYRTPARSLRQLATGHLLYEPPATKHSGDWDNFHIRNIGLAIQRRMVERFGGVEQKMRRACVSRVERALGAQAANWNDPERRAFSELALVLDLIPDLARWSSEEKRAVVRIVRAKAGAEELLYARLLQKHSRLRARIIEIGSTENVSER